jgi:hypothetical protein
MCVCVCVCVCSYGNNIRWWKFHVTFPCCSDGLRHVAQYQKLVVRGKTQGETGRRTLGTPRSGDGSMGRSRRRNFHSVIIVVPAQRPRGLRSRAMDARLLGLRVWIPPEVWVFVSCECCEFLQVETSATGWSLVQGSPTDCEYVTACGYVQQWPAVDLQYLVIFLYLVLLLYSVIYFKLAQLHYSLMFSSVGCIAVFSHNCFSWLY